MTDEQIAEVFREMHLESHEEREAARFEPIIPERQPEVHVSFTTTTAGMLPTAPLRPMPTFSEIVCDAPKRSGRVYRRL